MEDHLINQCITTPEPWISSPDSKIFYLGVIISGKNHPKQKTVLGIHIFLKEAMDFHTIRVVVGRNSFRTSLHGTSGTSPRSWIFGLVFLLRLCWGRLGPGRWAGCSFWELWWLKGLFQKDQVNTEI